VLPWQPRSFDRNLIVFIPCGLLLQYMKTKFHWFRQIAISEGISFLLLLLVAMPLKYFAGLPMAVTIVGALHGVLFIAFVYLAWEVKNEYNKNAMWFGKAFISSLLPFGTIVMDKQWRKEEQQIANRKS
jgi:integral membrane protein